MTKGDPFSYASWMIKPEPVNVRGICIVCNERQQMGKGNGMYRPQCRKCLMKRWPNLKRTSTNPWERHKGTFCVKCGPDVAYHRCQLDVDHIDGNKKNNDPSNYQTLCANCHRLKTFEQRDWESK